MGPVCNLRLLFPCFLSDDLSIDVSQILNFLTVLLSIFSFLSINIRFTYLGVPMSGAYMFTRVVASCALFSLSLRSVLLYLLL